MILIYYLYHESVEPLLIDYHKDLRCESRIARFSCPSKHTIGFSKREILRKTTSVTQNCRIYMHCFSSMPRNCIPESVGRDWEPGRDALDSKHLRGYRRTSYADYWLFDFALGTEELL